MAPSKEFCLRTILEKDKLNGTNYIDWICNLRIILKAEKKEEVLDTPLPEEPDENATLVEKNTYNRHGMSILKWAALCFCVWNLTCKCSLSQFMCTIWSWYSMICSPHRLEP
jgi:hypothetical protein